MSIPSGDNFIVRAVPVLQIIGYKNSGKTTLACKLIAALTAQGLRVGSAKHDAHEFRLDDYETDSEKHLSHGALETILTSSTATRSMRKSSTSLDEIAQQLYGKVDIIIAEGFKSARYPKIALIHHAVEMRDLLAQAADIRLWISWEAHEDLQEQGLTLQIADISSKLILYIKEQEDILHKAISLARSLL
ncbi:molybdopterin-guanine dinucleotide biosynthesis protein B [Paenibacillus sp. UMB4589-SE434]|uniref:molybdopterin-guanine dinucleotide biosynthesis protein B n=1 Tax=Paenibacillus sp. UMB4589-SE434 TaxID=3046314 RepID=UPI00254FF49A|nr:molybdopterin-guanine dinucleotide biosynthesis protein B [Paenibacillus sp. UMB4589-SE434]MDK8180214.1 molybdopterin-guanine dinucleotide biosynthesis protein B [Paenibacillus sp. UMB4589-SE434]